MIKDKRDIDFLWNERKTYKPSFEHAIGSILDDFKSSPLFHGQMIQYETSPLVALPALANELSIGSIQVKNEASRFGIPAIKMLGASFAVHQILQQDKEVEEFCTATDGNHGRAVAWAAGNASKSATIFVPKHTVESRIQAIRNEGAKVIVVEDDYDAAVKQASEYAKNTGARLVQDTAWENYLEIPAYIMAGYYTQLHEIGLQTNNFAEVPDIIFVQSGVGSWPAAVTHWTRNHPKLAHCKIICVEPFNSDCFLESAKCKALRATKKSQQTIMAGLNCGTPSLLAWEIMHKEIDLFLSIDDHFALDAMKKLYYPLGEDERIESGESGAAGLAGLLALLESPKLNSIRKKLKISKHTQVLLFNTEAATDPVFFQKHVL